MRIGKCLAMALVVATVGAAARGATIPGLGGEEYNGFVTLPPGSMTGGATAFTMVFGGDVVGSIDTSATQSDPGLNPFQYVNQYIVGSGTTSVTATLDGDGNTVVTFTGSNPILSNYGFGFANGLPHFGIGSSSAGQVLDILSQAWSNGSSTEALPTLSVSLAAAGDPPPSNYIIFFADVTSGGNTVGQWFEIPNVNGGTPPVVLTNYTGTSETLSDVGFYLSPTQIPLDDLNFNDNPPPGMPGSPFAPLPSLDGTSLAPGGSITFSTPEPSGLVLLGTGLFVAAGSMWRRQLAGRGGRIA